MSVLDRLGRSANELADIDIDDFNKLTRKELALVTSRLASAANKRLKSFEEHGETPPAYRDVMKSGGKFSVRDKNLNQLRAEYARVRRFLKARTSTIKGAAKVKQDMIDRLGMHDMKLPNAFLDAFWDFLDTFWDIYSEMSELRFQKGTSQTAQEYLADIVYREWRDNEDYSEEGDFAALLERVRNAEDDAYELSEDDGETSDDYLYI